ncbi:MAG: amino acid racemase [Candidatus Paceibacterota bacterium]
MTQAKASPKEIIGILGGMGPAASAEFYRRIVDIAQHEYGADQDTDFPPMYLYNLPLSGFDETGFRHPDEVKKQLVAGVKKLAASGSDFIVIPCNTVHAFIADMQHAVEVPIVSIIDSVADETAARGLSTVGLLSSESTRRYQLYETALAERNVRVVSANDEEQGIANKIIHKVMAGTQGPTEVSALRTIIERFANEGAQAVILGCTELPLAIQQPDIHLPLLSSTDILAHAALTRVYGPKN